MTNSLLCSINGIPLRVDPNDDIEITNRYIDTSNISDHITVMKYQEEESIYKCSSNCKLTQSSSNSSISSRTLLSNQGTTATNTNALTTDHIDSNCRIQMCKWCYQLVDHCGFSRECVYVAMSYVDRYLNTKSGSRSYADREIYKLTVMTALCMAIKIREPVVISMSQLIVISGSKFKVIDIETMEKSILSALQWRINCPTPFDFIRYFLEVMRKQHQVSDPMVINVIGSCARYQIELSVASKMEYFRNCIPSKIAFAAVMNSISNLNVIDPIIQDMLLSNIENYCSGMKYDDDIIMLESELNSLFIGGNKNNNNRFLNEQKPNHPLSSTTITNVRCKKSDISCSSLKRKRSTSICCQGNHHNTITSRKRAQQ